MRRVLLLAAITVGSFFALPAYAGTVTYNILISGGPAANPAFTASYTLTLDPTLSYQDASNGLKVNSYSGFDGSVAAGFSYDRSYSPLLEIGGLPGGVDFVMGSIPDYRFDIDNFLTGPSLTYIDLGLSPSSYIYGTSGAVQVTQVVPAAAVTPEPSGLALLGTGALGLLGVARKRFV